MFVRKAVRREVICCGPTTLWSRLTENQCIVVMNDSHFTQIHPPIAIEDPFLELDIGLLVVWLQLNYTIAPVVEITTSC